MVQRNIERSGRRIKTDVYAFIQSVLTTVKDKEAFSVFHLGEVDSRLYLSTVNSIIDDKPSPKWVFSEFMKIDEKMFIEKSRKHPNIDKLRQLKTLHMAYQDILEFMATYDTLIQFKQGRQNILQVCTATQEG